MRNDTQQMLDERLRTLDPVDRDHDRSAHLHAQALMHSILSGERPLHASDVRQRMRPARQPRAFDLGRVGSLAAALIVALVVCGITTPPGKAVTRWVGQRIGIATGSSPRTGQPGGQPSLQSLRDFAHQGASAAGGQPAIVMARGNLPYGRHYEVVAYRPKPAGRGTGTGRVCFELDFPEVRSLGTLGCELPARSTSLVFQEAGENATATRSFSYATGLVGNDVTEVDVSTHGHPADVQLIRIPPESPQAIRSRSAHQALHGNVRHARRQRSVDRDDSQRHRRPARRAVDHDDISDRHGAEAPEITRRQPVGLAKRAAEVGGAHEAQRAAMSAIGTPAIAGSVRSWRTRSSRRSRIALCTPVGSPAKSLSR